MKYPERIFVTSDQHFGHANIIKYCRRPFRDINEMNNTLLNSWNSMVRKYDVFLFGEDSIDLEDFEETKRLLTLNDISDHERKYFEEKFEKQKKNLTERGLI